LFTLGFGERSYQIKPVPKLGPGQLKVVIRAEWDGKKFLDTVNLYSGRARASFLGHLVMLHQGSASQHQLEEDLFFILEAVEKRLDRVHEVEKADEMTLAEKQEALSFLTRNDLDERILDDLTTLGVVGEEDNKLLGYLVATSRKLAKPLSLSVISRSSAGKSWLLNRVADLMPPEEVLRYTRMSPRALFYDEPGKFKHKILFIEEAIGAKDADLGVRSMQSEKRLANLATMTDPKTGQLKTQETVVEGPLTYLTSSVDPLDHETATRSFEIAIDESSDQTGRIVASLLRDRTLEGIQAKLRGDSIQRRHQNAQRLLEPVLVVNPYTSQLTFPKDTLRLRREADKYLSLIDTLAFLHQKQREVDSFDLEGATYRYILVTVEDIDRANRLMVRCLARALSDLPGPAQELLLKIRDYVMKQCEQTRQHVTEVPFSRRDIREWVRWSDYQVRLYLDLLSDLEYVETTTGSFGKRYIYTLSPDHRLLVQATMSEDERIEALGLTPANRLQEPM